MTATDIMGSHIWGTGALELMGSTWLSGSKGLANLIESMLPLQLHFQLAG